MTATVDQYGAWVSARPISSNRIASSRKPSPAPPFSSATETPVQPSSASSCQDGSGLAARKLAACARSSSCSGVNAKSIG